MKKFLVVLTLFLSICTVSFATFSDMPKNEMYKTAIEGLVKKGVLNGYDDGTFAPANPITRAEFVKMIVTATNAKESKENTFSDVATNHWAKEFINIAVKNNFVEGYEDNTFRPEEKITYGEVVTVVIRALASQTKLDSSLSWPMNYMKAAEELNLFDGYYTNDLVATNSARRDNVALILWNALNIKTEDNNNEEVDTKTAYAGIVKEIIERRGETFVVTDDGEFKLYKESQTPKMNSFVIYQFTSTKQMKIRKELALSDVDASFLTIEDVDECIVKIQGKEKLLDFDLDNYEIDGTNYKLSKYNYFILTIDGKEIASYELFKKDTLKLKKDDKIKFDEKLNVCYIIREA